MQCSAGEARAWTSNSLYVLIFRVANAESIFMRRKSQRTTTPTVSANGDLLSKQRQRVDTTTCCQAEATGPSDQAHTDKNRSNRMAHERGALSQAASPEGGSGAPGLRLMTDMECGARCLPSPWPRSQTPLPRGVGCTGVRGTRIGSRTNDL